MTQNEAILERLKQGHSVDPIWALETLGCFRLASRINELKSQGHNIGKEMITCIPTGSKHAEYFLIKEKL